MAGKTGCATCQDLSALAGTLGKIREDMDIFAKKIENIEKVNLNIQSDIKAILKAVDRKGESGSFWDKLNAIFSFIAAASGVWAGLGKGELKSLLTETKKKANDAQYAAEQVSIKSDKILEQSLLSEANSIIRDAEIRKLSNNSLYASTQASIKADKIGGALLHLSNVQNENFEVVRNDIGHSILKLANLQDKNFQVVRDDIGHSILKLADSQDKNFQAISGDIEWLIKNSGGSQKIVENFREVIVREIPVIIKTEVPKIIKQESPAIAREVAKSPEIKPIVEVVPTLRGFMREVAPEVKKIDEVDKTAKKIYTKPGGIKEFVEETNKAVKKEIASISNKQKQPSEKFSLDDIAKLITPLPALISANNPVKNPEVFNKISDAAATGICKTTQPGGCMGKALSDLGNRNSQGLNNLGSKMDAANLAANAAQLALLKKIDTTTVTNGIKLGSQLANGGIGQKLVRIGNMLKLPQILSIANFAVSTHNALMLSRDIGDTLGSVIDTAIRLVVPKDSELAGINVSEIIGREFRELLVNIVGVENFAELSVNFAKANRIYQAGSNLLWSIQSINDNSLMVGTAIFENVSLIGNALKKARTINDNAFDWMSPNMSAQFRWQKRLENLDEAAGFLLLISSGLLGVKESIEESVENKKELDKAIADAKKPVADKQKREVIASLVSDGVIDESWDVGEAE